MDDILNFSFQQTTVFFFFKSKTVFQSSGLYFSKEKSFTVINETYKQIVKFENEQEEEKKSYVFSFLAKKNFREFSEFQSSGLFRTSRNFRTFQDFSGFFRIFQNSRRPANFSWDGERIKVQCFVIYNLYGDIIGY